MSGSRETLTRIGAQGSFVFGEKNETMGSLAHRPAGGERRRTSREARSRAPDWNGPEVQLAQGRLCRTAVKGSGSIEREWVLDSACPYMEVVLLTTNDPATELRNALEKLGAREFEHVALSLDPARGLAALVYAQSKGADNPIAYAIKLFDNPDWKPAGEVRRVATNLSVDRKCIHCGGDRFVFVTDDVDVLYGQTVAPCIYCNKDANTVRWVGDERRETAAR